MGNENSGLNGLGQGQNVDLTKQQNGYEQQTNQGNQQDFANSQYGQNGQQFNQGNQQDFANSQYGQNGQQFSQQANGSGFSFMPGNVFGYTTANAPDYMLWLILGIIQMCTICCCNCMTLLTGIITVVLVVAANKAYQQGNATDYMSKIKMAKIVCCIGFGLLIAGWVVGIFSGLLQTVLEAVGI